LEEKQTFLDRNQTQLDARLRLMQEGHQFNGMVKSRTKFKSISESYSQKAQRKLAKRILKEKGVFAVNDLTSHAKVEEFILNLVYRFVTHSGQAARVAIAEDLGLTVRSEHASEAEGVDIGEEGRFRLQNFLLTLFYSDVNLKAKAKAKSYAFSKAGLSD